MVTDENGLKSSFSEVATVIDEFREAGETDVPVKPIVLSQLRFMSFTALQLAGLLIV